MAAVRKKRVIGSLSAAALALLLFAAVFCIASNAAVIKRGAFSDGSDDGEKYDCVLILGALVLDDGSPSAMLAFPNSTSLLNLATASAQFETSSRTKMS